MSEFKKYYKNSKWFGTYESDLMMAEAYNAGQQSQQAEIEQLKAKNEKTQKQFNFLLDKNIRDESAHATLKLKFMEVSRLVRSLRSEFDLWSDSPPVERQIELLEEIMRGGHE